MTDSDTDDEAARIDLANVLGDDAMRDQRRNGDGVGSGETRHDATTAGEPGDAAQTGVPAVSPPDVRRDAAGTAGEAMREIGRAHV